jgi:hypothetical protein
METAEGGIETCGKFPVCPGYPSGFALFCTSVAVCSELAGT